MKEIGTNLKCRYCGKEITFIKSWGRIDLYHTGVEEGFVPNRHCHMVSKSSVPVMEDTEAELTSSDLEAFVEWANGKRE